MFSFLERAKHVQDFVDKHQLQPNDIVAASIYTVQGMKILLQLEAHAFNKLFDPMGPSVIVGDLELTRYAPHLRVQGDDECTISSEI